MYQVIKNYRTDEKLRLSFNELAKSTFGLDFDEWYQNGYWTDRYNPYSIVIDGEVAVNVSVNITDFQINGEVKKYIQLGTVMTKEEYRNKGLIREIMEEIEKDYAGKIDGIYLFANDRVTSFYPKFGFKKSEMYEYYRNLEANKNNECIFAKVPMNNKKEWDVFQEKIQKSVHYAACEMLDNSQLNMFYVSKFMQENIYYSAKLDVYVIAEIEEDNVLLHMVISDAEQDLNSIVNGFGKDIKHVVLGFTPKNTMEFEVSESSEDDCTLFVKGDFAVFEDRKLMVPTLAHA